MITKELILSQYKNQEQREIVVKNFDTFDESFDETQTLKKLHDDITSFNILYLLKQYYEFNGLSTYGDWSFAYIEIHQKLKNKALKDSSVNPKQKESAFYDWLRICVNTDNDPNVEFFFKDKKIDREQQVREILFENGCVLRQIFKTTQWQIRLKKIIAWFLRRYDIITACKIYRGLKLSTVKPGPSKVEVKLSKLELVDFLMPRLLGSILIGFLFLIQATKIWEFYLYIDWPWPFVFATISVIFSSMYFKLEYFKVTGKTDNVKILIVLGMGILYSLLISFIVTISFSKVVYTNDNANIYNLLNGTQPLLSWNIYSFMFCPRIWILHASFALIIGILLQAFWEEKTITDQL